MKVATLLLCIAVLASAASPSSRAWQHFKAQHGRQYESAEEERYRQSVFEQNQQFIDDHNAKYENGEVTFTLQMNQFGDMTTEEINAAVNGYVMSDKRRSVAKLTDGGSSDLAKEVDWRTKGAVTPVKDQQQCGSCWAFSATGSLEGQHFLKEGKLVSLSEQNLVDCSNNFGNFGCGGGLMDNAFRYIKSNGGIDTEESYPYEAKDGRCRFSNENIGATVRGYVDVEQGNEAALKTAVAKIGPVSVAIDASLQTFHFYSSGVYYDSDCSPTQLDHGVLAVGYGTSDDGKDYWLVKNSWNAEWGDRGYIKMARNKDNNCGIATQSSYPLV